MIKSVASWLEKVCSRSRCLTELLGRPYLRAVRNEVRLARIAKSDRVLSVGCGAVPFTAIHVARLTGALVVALDHDPQAVELARRCVARLGLDKLVTVEHCDGSEWGGEGFDVAIVALQACRKNAVLSCLCAEDHGPRRVIVREPGRAFRTLYDDSVIGWPVSGQVRQNLRTFDQSVLIAAGGARTG